MSVVIVTGVPGVGKSTVMNAAQDYGYKIVNFGSTMFEEAQKEGVENRDDMRKLPIEKQQSLQKQAGERIAQMGDVVVDTHASILTPSGYMPGLPEWTISALKPNIIVLVEATAQEIAGRRSKDPSRMRDADDIDMHQKVNRDYAETAASIVGATVSIVENHDNQIEIAVEQFRKVLSK
jgi:adenylate kinase